MSKSSIEVLHETDLAALIELEMACFDHPWSEKQLSTYLVGERYLCFGLWQATRLQGFALLSTVLDEAELLQIGVHPDYRGRGGATELLRYVHAQLDDQGINRCLLEVRSSNAAALRLYRRLAYQEDGIRKGYYPTASGSEDAILMSCNKFKSALDG